MELILVLGYAIFIVEELVAINVFGDGDKS